MAPDERSSSRKDADGKQREAQIPPPDGSTYLTSRHAKTGVGYEPEPIDVRKNGENAD